MDQENNNHTTPAPQPRYAQPEIDDILADDPDEAPTEWVPTRFEKRVKAISEARWTLYQILGGSVIGIITVITLFFGGKGKGFSYGFMAAVVLALLAPNWLEDRARRKVTKGRIAMIVVIAVGIVFMVLYTGFTQGWSLFKPKAAEEAARMLGLWLA